ncbi:UvrD-helicase domain-containing protein [Brunnivagina elsteri]|uniref:DNA 3'-5' helicase n=1 Tax=Brunnivagina elsteri CCALA 953 TaxID=987040 RepID=A0A2A2TDP8_9CYAN|nr:UvrD-helicase domain-containing protein [Calothrix elsteri]PAX51755.1 DNA helicase UvrD [Calothrix elsteri CCALA 953]
MNFEIIHKPTFTNQLLVFPKEQVVQILEKIEVLRNDPKPHGKLKKKLHGYKGDVYRLRSGDYRIIYTYGDGWVVLMGVDARKDVYKGDKLFAQTTEIDINALPDVEAILTIKPSYTKDFSSPTATNTETLLPISLTEELLKRLRIPTEYWTNLIACKTLDDLTAINLPSKWCDIVFDCIAEPNFDRVLNQPSYVTGSTDDLLRFTEGELLGFLLKMNPEQEKFVNWAINASGPTLLKGGPGTGKSTVALYRVRALLATLQANGVKKPKILFTTYTNALIGFSQQLLESLLGEDIKYVEVKTADAIIASIINQNGKKANIASGDVLRKIMKKAIASAIESLEGNLLQRQAQEQTLKRLSIDYLIDEISTVITAREINTLEAYQTTSRTGREISLNKTQRQAIWHLRENFYQLLAEQGLETWHQLRSRALEILRDMDAPPLYDGVVIDEAQDLDPNTLRILTQICASPNRLFITADANQSIYGSSFRWSDVHQDLKFVGRTGVLRVNHRTTREINEAAIAYLTNGALDDLEKQREYVHSGPSPAVRAVNNAADEAELLTQFCQAATREYRLGISSCAVIVPTENVGIKIAGQLSYLGLEAHFMNSKELDLNKQGVKVITLKAAKGLEFPIVAIAGFLDGSYPIIAKGTPDEEITEILARERRTLFVAMTRAMRALLVIIPADNSCILLDNFDSQLWNLGNETGL